MSAGSYICSIQCRGEERHRARKRLTAMSNPKTAIDSEHADIVYPSAIPFVLVHLACIAALWTGITWRSVWIYARCSTGCASLQSVLHTINIFRIAPTQLAADSNSRLRSCLKARPKRACYGGRLNTAIDDIVDRAHGLNLDAVDARLRPNATSLS